MEADAKTLLLTCGAIVAGLLFLLGGLYFWRSGRELREQGVTTEATVVQKLRKGGGIENYYAVVTFTDLQGTPQTLELKVLSRAWHGLREGEPVTITYLPAQPEKSSVGAKWGKQLFGWFFLFLALAGGGMALGSLAVLIGLLTGKSRRGSF